MNKELFVSATPHETKVGITEDDQLAEIYLERENEYTLAGSIYTGRVTRVLPGMQSAFVDIGLERDAFLYVSDFMDLEQQDEDLDEPIPANRPVLEARPRPGLEAGGPATDSDGQLAEAGGIEGEGEEPEAASSEAPGNAGVARDFRGRRRRRGRRGETGGRGPSPERGERPERGEIRSEPRSEAGSEPRGEPRNESRNEPSRSEPSRNEPRNDRFNRGDRAGRSGSESRFQRPAATTARSGRDYDYGPPPGYQPIVLPGESISKYQRQSQNQAPALPAESAAAVERPASAAILANFPEDEPIFAAEITEPLHEQHEHVLDAEVEEEVHGTVSSAAPAAEDYQVRDQAQSALGTYSALETVHEQPQEADLVAAPQVTPDVTPDVSRDVEHGAVEEQEIEEEEADLTSYGEEPGDDEGFEELEEETRAAGGELSEPGVGEVAPALAAGGEPAANGDVVPEALLEAEEREAEELELEEAQAEAEALLEAEAIGDGTVDASAEVRGPAPEARLLQRTQRRGPERGFDRGRGRRGGRRFRSRENTVVPQISELLKEGQEVLIQIAKEPIGKKGARITSHIALPGRFLVFMPTVNHTGVSRKISSEEERQRLKRIIQSERENGGGGRFGRGTASRYPLSEKPLERDQVALRQQQVSGADLSRPECGGAGAARPGEFGIFGDLGRYGTGIRAHFAVCESLPAGSGQAR